MLNQGPFEGATFRATTGGAYNIIGAYGAMMKGSSFPTKGAIPVPTGKSGTIISTGNWVRGTDTKFLSEMQPGDYLYHKDVVRKIDFIDSDTMLKLTQEFPSDIASGEIPLLCQSQFYSAIYAKSTHATVAATLQEAPIAAGNTFLNQGAPISYDATSGQLQFQVHK